MRTAVFAFLLVIGTAVASSGQSRISPSARIVVGPNILVSRDDAGPHVELMLAAHPRNRRNLLGGAITMTRPQGGFATRAYASIDGGQTWHASSFAEQMRWGGADPQVAFTPNGTALFVTLTSVQDEEGRTRGGMHAYRSEDGGISWGPGVDLHYSWDHPMLTVDHTTGRFAGRAYIGVLYGYPVYRVGIFRSDDDGRTWTGPVEAANGKGEYGINVINLGVFGDGTLFVPFADFQFRPERRTDEFENGFWSVTSADGGLTFSEPVRVGTLRGSRNESRFYTFPQFVVDGRRDRVYVAWTDLQQGRARLWTRHSTDRGRTWSEPIRIDPGVPEDAQQYQPAIAVNDSGVVAVTWFDTRDAVDGRSYRQFISASVDGGISWLPATPVSEQHGDPYGDGNVRHLVNTWRPQPDSLRISLISAASRWGHGGDYMGLAADAAGVFHPWWTDARTGTFQIMTASVRIETGAPSAVPEQNLVERDVTPSVEIVADPTRFEDNIAVLPLRLRNIGDRPIHAPVILTIRGFGSGLAAELQEHAPEVLNASNGLPGAGATFLFTNVLGTAGLLEPGQITGAVEMRLRIADPLQIPDFHVAVTGRMATER